MGRVVVRAVGEVERRALRWLWPGRIPLGKLTILSGDPSLGKSFVTLDLAARVSAGGEWPGEEGVRRQESWVSGEENSKLGREPRRHRDTETAAPEVRDQKSEVGKSKAGRVLLLAAEDDIADTIRPRLEAAGADLGRVHFVEGLRDGEGNRGFVALHRDCETIADLLRGHADWRLIVIDPISAYFDGMDPNSNADVRIVMGRLADLAEETGAAVVLVSHHRKGGYGGPAIHRTIGSLAFAAVARVVWNVVRDPNDAERRLLVPVKMNLGRRPGGLAFRIVDEGCRKQDAGCSRTGVVEWERWGVEVGIDDLGENAFAETDAEDRLEFAREWLQGELVEGRRVSSELKRRAREAGIGERALWRAKRALKVTAMKDGMEGPWYWVPAAEKATMGVDLTRVLRPVEVTMGRTALDDLAVLVAQDPEGVAAAVRRAQERRRRSGAGGDRSQETGVGRGDAARFEQV